MDEFVVSTGTGVSVGTGVTTYSGLVSTLGDWLNRDDLGTRIPDFITLLEARLNRILRCPQMETSAALEILIEGVASPDVEPPLPTDFLQARAMYIEADPRQELQPVSLGTLRTSYAAQTTGKPEVYTITEGKVIFGPAPDDEYDVTLTYYQKIEPLSSDNESNWLSLSYPDVYLYGALVMAEAFLWNDERLPLWKSAWDEALGELQDAGKRYQYGAAPLRLRPSVKE